MFGARTDATTGDESVSAGIFANVSYNLGISLASNMCSFIRLFGILFVFVHAMIEFVSTYASPMAL